MRITVNIEDDVLIRLKQFANRRSLSLGQAASHLIRRGLDSPIQTRSMNGLQVLILPEDSPSVGCSRVKALLDGA